MVPPTAPVNTVAPVVLIAKVFAPLSVLLKLISPAPVLVKTAFAPKLATSP